MRVLRLIPSIRELREPGRARPRSNAVTSALFLSLFTCLLSAGTARADVITYEGFPTDGDASTYAHNAALAGSTLVHTSHVGFAAADDWGTGTGTVRSWSNGLSYATSDANATPQPGAATTMYRQGRGTARDLDHAVGQARAEAGIYVSALVRWAHADMEETFGGFVSAQVNGTSTPSWNNLRGVFVGFVDDGANRDLVVRYRNTGGTSSDVILVDNMTMGSDYFVVVKMVQGTGANPDKLWAEAYGPGVGEYPGMEPASWAAGDTDGLDASNLEEGGATPIGFLQLWGGGGSGTWVGGAQGNPGGLIDEMTLGEEWLDVVPATPFYGHSTWPYTMEIELDGYTGRSSSLTNFPVLCVFSNNMAAGFSYDQFARADGYDLRFSSTADGADSLNYEIDEWDTSGVSYVWVQVPELSNTTTKIYAFWGNAAAGTPACATDGSTWSEGHVGVWHMKESGNTPADSALVGGDNTGIDSGTDGVVTDAVIGKGYDYTDNGRVDMGNKDDFTGLSEATLMVWYYKRGQGGANYGTLFGAPDNRWGLRHHVTDALDLRLNALWVVSPGNLADGAWHCLAYTFDDATGAVRVYVNGTLASSGTTSESWHDSGQDPIHLIGSGNLDARAVDGIVDEMRASSVVRSADWIWAAYRTSASNTSFTTYGAVTSRAPYREWANKMEIDLGGYTKPDTLTNFPVLVVLSNGMATGFSYDDFLSFRGGDLRFADGDEAIALAYEVDEWNTNAGASSLVWVQVPELTNGSSIHMYMGKTGVAHQACNRDGSVWSEGYEGVWHLSELDTARADATRNGNDGSRVGSVSKTSQDLVGTADEFTEGGNYHDVGSDLTGIDGSSELTVSGWIFANAVGGGSADDSGILCRGASGSSVLLWLNDDAGGSAGTEGYSFNVGDAATGGNRVEGTANSALQGQWQYVAGVMNGVDRAVYLDGAVNASHSSGVATTVPAGTGTRLCSWSGGGGGNLDHDGKLDEVRVSTVARSTSWIWAEFMNMASNDAFNTYGEVLGNLPAGPAVTTLAASGMTTDGATLNGDLTSTGTAETAVWVYWGDEDGTNNPAAWDTNEAFGVQSATGALSTNLTGLTPSTTYYYRFYASNSVDTAWADTSTNFATLALTQPPEIANLAPSNLDTNAATLRGDLTSTGTAETTVWVYFGDEDGGADLNGWDTNYAFGVQSATGVLTTNLTGLSATTHYYYRFFASNSVDVTWASETERFVTPTDFGDWYRRMPITLNYDRSTPLTNFPVLINLSESIAGFDYDDCASATGGDLRFAMEDEVSTLYHEIDEWHTDGTSAVWVQIPVLTNGAAICAYWGNASATTAPAYTTNGSVWSEGFVGVWHLSEQSGHVSDSSPYGNDSTASAGDPNLATNGVIGSAAEFDGNDNFQVPDDPSLDESVVDLTISAWAYRYNTGSNQGIVGKRSPESYYFFFDGSDIKFDVGSGTRMAEPSGVSAHTWYHLAGVFEPGLSSQELKYYRDGAVRQTQDNAQTGIADGGASLQLGSIESGNFYLNGMLDEVRVATVARSADWLRACYVNMASNDVFVTPGTPTLGIGWSAVSTLAATGETTSGATLRGDLTSTGTSATAVWVYWGDEDGTNNPSAWDTNEYFGVADVTGVLSTNVTGMDDDTVYYYRFAASNDAGRAWASNTVSVTTEVDFTKWLKTLPISFTNYNRATPLTNFPALVKLSTSITGFSYDDFESAQGNDLRFSAGDGTTTLNYEVEKWDTGGESLVWVRVPVFTNNVTIHAYWGSADSTGPDLNWAGAAVWADEYLGVYHLHADSDDSTANGNDGTPTGPTNATGIVGDGLGFDGNDDDVDLGAGTRWEALDQLHENAYTLGVWVNPNTIASDQALIGRYNEQTMFWLDIGGGKVNYAAIVGTGSIRTPEGSGIEARQGEWQYVAVTANGSALSMYVNGAFSGSYSGTVNIPENASKSYYLGTSGDTDKYLNGLLDEARIAATPRHVDWLWAEYMNIASNGAFNTYSNAVYNRPTEPEVTTLAYSGVGETNATLRGELTSTGTAETAVWVYWGDEDGTNNISAWDTNEAFGVQSATGVLSTNLTGLADATTYYYRYYASNSVGGAWADASTNFTTIASIRAPEIENLAATGVTHEAAWLRGDLTSTGTAETTVWVYWGDNDADTNALSWDANELFGVQSGTGVLTTNITGLPADTTHYFRFYASNSVGGAWAPSTETFGTALDYSDWSRKLRIDFTYDRATPLTNFPALVKLSTALTGFSYDDFASATGGDLRLLSSDERTELNYEVEEWDTGGESCVWVQVPELTSNSYIFAYWGNPSETTAPASTTNGATWDSTFRAVWHLDQTNGSLADLTDSTTNDCDGANQGTANFDGVISKGQDFDRGSNNHINLLTTPASEFLPAVDSPITLSCWVKPKSIGSPGNDNRMINIRQAVGSSALVLALGQSDRANVYHADGDSNGTLASAPGTVATGTWYYAAVTFDAQTLRLYLDGAFQSQQADGLSAGSSDIVKLGTFTGGGQFFDGIIDEMRVSKISRSADWIRASWLNQGSNDVFNSYGTVQNTGDANLPDIRTLAATNILITTAYMNGELASTGTSATTVSVYWGPTNGGTDTLIWSNRNDFAGTQAVGPLTTNMPGLTPSTTYYYRYYATNATGGAWATATKDFTTYGLPAVTNLDATGVTVASATLRGELLDGHTADATIYWGLTDGGETASAWANTSLCGTVSMGAFSTSVTVRAGGQYYYRCYVDNGSDDDWANATASFVTPTATVSIADASVTEGDGGATNMAFTVTLSAASASNVTVRYASADDSATAGSDYTAVDSTLLFTPGETSKGFTVTVQGDTDEEGQETFHVNLSQATNCTPGDAQAVGTIVDDDVDIRDWLYKLKITFSGYDGAETLTNFPALVELSPSITSFAYAQFESPYAHDLRFVDSTGTMLLSYEIEEWNPSGSSYVWVRVPEISGTDSHVWAYWGSTGALTAVSGATDLSDCVLWLKADAGVVTSGVAVTSWQDQSGQGNHATQGTAGNQPTYVASGLNGEPVVRFDGGSADFMTVADDSSLDNTAGLTIFAVVTPSNLNGSPRAILSKRAGNNNNHSYAQFFYTGDTLWTDIVNNNDRFISTTVFTNGNTYVTELLYDGSQPVAGDRVDVAVDGAHDKDGAETSTSIPDYTSPLVLGKLDTGYTSYLGADYAEIIIYRRALTSDERQSVGRYLAQKYGLDNGYGTDAPSYATDCSTWSEGYGGVWHLTEGGSDTRFDSTANDNDSTSLVSDPDAASGRIGNGNAFDGDDSIVVPDSDSIGDDTVDSMSVSVWLNSAVDLTGSGTHRTLEKGDSYFLLEDLGNGGMNFLVKPGNKIAEIGQGLSAGQWYHLTGTFDGSDVRIYLNGVLKGTDTVGGNIDDDGLPLRIGSDDGEAFFDGVLDEVRISTVTRSAAWVRATFVNTASNDVFGVRGTVTPTHGPTLFVVH